MMLGSPPPHSFLTNSPYREMAEPSSSGPPKYVYTSCRLMLLRTTIEDTPRSERVTQQFSVIHSRGNDNKKISDITVQNDSVFTNEVLDWKCVIQFNNETEWIYFLTITDIPFLKRMDRYISTSYGIHKIVISKFEFDDEFKCDSDHEYLLGKLFNYRRSAH